MILAAAFLYAAAEFAPERVFGFIRGTLVPYVLSFSPAAALVWMLYFVNGL